MSALSIALSILHNILLCQMVRGMATFGRSVATKVFVI